MLKRFTSEGPVYMAFSELAFAGVISAMPTKVEQDARASDLKPRREGTVSVPKVSRYSSERTRLSTKASKPSSAIS